MGRAGGSLTLDEIIFINRRMLEASGGFLVEHAPFQNRNSLEYALEAVDGVVFGQELYPTLPEKAAMLAWSIITNHIFRDGNKRTGLETCRLFLEVNNVRMRMGRNLIEIAVQAAEPSEGRPVAWEEFLAAVQANCEPLNKPNT